MALGILFIIFSLPAFSETAELSFENINCPGLEALVNKNPENSQLLIKVSDVVDHLKTNKEAETVKCLETISKEEKHIPAAYILAKYKMSVGTFDAEGVDKSNLNESIEAHLKVLSLIDENPNYSEPKRTPKDLLYQVELSAYYYTLVLYLNKFTRGALGIRNQVIMEAPGYEGDSNLKTYPEYQDTLKSAEMLFEISQKCMDLPLKSYFDEDFYKSIKKACGGLRYVGHEMIYGEKKRLALLEREDCRNQLSDCWEYDDIETRMAGIVLDDRYRREVIFARLAHTRKVSE